MDVTVCSLFYDLFGEKGRLNKIVPLSAHFHSGFEILFRIKN